MVRSYNEAFKSYTQAFYYGDDLQKGIEWAAKTSERNFARTRFSIDYVRKHPESVVSLEILQELCRRQTELDKEEIEALFESLAPQLRDSEAGRYTGQCIREKNIWVGHAVPDLELRDLELRRCRLSDHIRPGHVTLIEIWASWCNPCRGDIPYVKRAYDTYHKRGFDIVGISIDDAAERWKRAVEEENMPWPQLNDPEKKSFRLFDTKAVPTAILIDEEGRILKLNARGGWLFATLQQIYGK